MSKKISDYAYLLSIAVSIVLFDQFTKWLVLQNLASEEVWSPWSWLMPYARIVNWHNTGIAFGLFQNGNTLFIILAILVSIGILYYFPKVSHEEGFLRFAMALQLGGAVGNMIDRIRQGYVTDFVSLGTFPVFNVADSSISIGVVVLLVGVWYMDMKNKKTQKPATGEANGDPEKVSEDQK